MKNLKIIFSIGLLISTAHTVIYSAAAAEPAAKRHKMDPTYQQDALNKSLKKAIKNEGEQTETVAHLISQRADVNMAEEAFLVDGAFRGHTEVTRLLLQAQADIDAQDDREGETALIRAAYLDRREIISLLLQKKADTNIQDYQGETALINASSQGCNEIIRLLLQKKADTNIQNHSEETALMAAASSQNASVETLKLLLRNGADLMIPETRYKETIQKILISQNDHDSDRKKMVFAEHMGYLGLLMGKYNKAIINNEIKDKKIILDIRTAQHHFTEIEKELLTLELSLLFNELNLVANKTGAESLFQYFKE